MPNYLGTEQKVNTKEMASVKTNSYGSEKLANANITHLMKRQA